MVITDESIGISQLLGACARALPKSIPMATVFLLALLIGVYTGSKVTDSFIFSQHLYSASV